MDLKPCPFCGANPVVVERIGGWSVSCYYSDPLNALNATQCLDIITGLFPTKEQAVRQWNKRPTEEALCKAAWQAYIWLSYRTQDRPVSIIHRLRAAIESVRGWKADV